MRDDVQLLKQLHFPAPASFFHQSTGPAKARQRQKHNFMREYTIEILYGREDEIRTSRCYGRVTIWAGQGKLKRKFLLPIARTCNFYRFFSEFGGVSL